MTHLKIISLESIVPMDVDENTGTPYTHTRSIKVGHPYDDRYYDYTRDSMTGDYTYTERHSNRDVVKIEHAGSESGQLFIVTLKDNHVLNLPANAFIAELVEVSDDGKN